MLHPTTNSVVEHCYNHTQLLIFYVKALLVNIVGADEPEQQQFLSHTYPYYTLRKKHNPSGHVKPLNR